MYQSVLRDPGGNSLIRILPVVCDRHHAVVNGSILIVPPDTKAFVAINGILSRPYDPGRYEISTGVDPFFVKLRNIMSHGDPGTTVSVFYVSDRKSKLITLGTGKIPYIYSKNNYMLTMNPLATCNLTISIADPARILEKLVGKYSSSYMEEYIEESIKAIICPFVVEAVSRGISGFNIDKLNSNLSQISRTVFPTLRPELLEYGIGLERFSVERINFDQCEMERLQSLEDKTADGIIRTDNELYNLDKIWNHDVHARTLSEALTGIPSRGQAPVAGTTCNPGGNVGGMDSFIRLAFATSMLPNARDFFSDFTSHSHTDMMRGSSSDSHANTSSADSGSPPPLPSRRRRCPSCHGEVDARNTACPICGHRFNERNN